MDGFDVNAAATAQALKQREQWLDRKVAVVGIGIAGYACADALLQRGAAVSIFDSAAGPAQRERAAILELLGATVVLGRPPVVDPDCELVVVSPGVPPASPVIVDALARGVTVWGELELAWALRGDEPLAA
ncbi:MAG: hypothetical protein WCP28_22050, partial [Actinomycetes bacterium]